MSSNGNILVLGSAPRSGEAGQRTRVSAQNADGASRRGHARQAEPRAGRRAHAKGAVAADHEPVAVRSASSNRTASASGAAQAVAAEASAANARAAAREEARAKRAAARERAQRGASDERAGKQGSAKGFSLFAGKDEKAAKGTEKATAGSRAAKGRGSSVTSAGEGRSAGASAKDRAASVATGGVQGILAWFMSHKRLSITLGVILALAIVVYPPACSLYSAARSNAILSAKLSEATATADTLQSEVDSLMTREGIEDEARRRGYVSEGETAVDMSGVEDSGSASSDSTVTESTSDSEEDPWYIQALDFVFRYDASTQGIGK